MTVADDINQTGRNFHLASIQFNTSKSDVLFRLTVLDNHDEVTSTEGKGTVVLPAFLFMRDVTNTNQATPTAQLTTTTAAASTTTAGPPSSSRPTSKTGGQSIKMKERVRDIFIVGAIKKDGVKGSGGGPPHRGSVADSTGIGSGRSDKEKGGSGKRSVSQMEILFRLKIIQFDLSLANKQKESCTSEWNDCCQ